MNLNYLKDWGCFVVLRELSIAIHEINVWAGWWRDKDGRTISAADRTPTCLLLIHSEISEATEAFRKGLKDDKLPHRDGLEVELADALIRIFDLAGAHGFDLGKAVQEKMIYNASRADHKPENRAKEGGKRF